MVSLSYGSSQFTLNYFYSLGVLIKVIFCKLFQNVTPWNKRLLLSRVHKLKMEKRKLVFTEANVSLLSFFGSKQQTQP